QYVSLWTYEAGMAMLIFAPILLLRRDVPWKRIVAWTAAWSIVPLFSIGQIFYRYWIAREVSYQSAELATHVSPGYAVTHLGQFAAQGLEFWRWPERWLGPQGGCEIANLRTFAWPLAIGVVAFVLASAMIVRAEWRQRLSRPYLTALFVAALFLALAYAPYLALAPDKVAPWWRTQFFAAAPAAIVIV